MQVCTTQRPTPEKGEAALKSKATLGLHELSLITKTLKRSPWSLGGYLSKATSRRQSLRDYLMETISRKLSPQEDPLVARRLFPEGDLMKTVSRRPSHPLKALSSQ